MLPFQKLSSSVLGVPPPISCTISVKDIVAVGLFSKNTLKKIVSVVFIKLSFTIELPSVAGVKTRDCHW